MNARPSHCVGCGWPLRGNRYSAQQRPGTRQHSGRGVCTTCRRREREAEKAATKATENVAPEFDVQFARYALESFMNNLPSRKART